MEPQPISTNDELTPEQPDRLTDAPEIGEAETVFTHEPHVSPRPQVNILIGPGGGSVENPRIFIKPFQQAAPDGTREPTDLIES